MCRIALFLISLGFISLFGFGQKAHSGMEAATRASLPNTTPDITPSRGIGPFDAKQAQEWGAAAEVLCAQSRYAEAEKLYLKLLEEREHNLGLNNPELATDLNDLGRVSFAQMKYQQAIAYYERVVQIMETSKGRTDMALAVPLDKLTRTSQEIGRAHV